MHLELFNSRNRAVYLCDLDDTGREGVYKTENGGGRGPRDLCYRAAAVVACDVASARPVGPLAGPFVAHVQAHRAEWPFSDIADRKAFGGREHSPAKSV